MEHASAPRAYDIIILHRDIAPENQALLQSMAEGRENISIRFLNVADKAEGYPLYTGGKKDLTIDACLRLLIPDILDSAYHKALYLDADMLALADVGELLDTDLDCVHAPVSFRVGRAITRRPPKLRGGVRCYREHGLGYTARRTVEHLTGRA